VDLTRLVVPPQLKEVGYDEFSISVILHIAQQRGGLNDLLGFPKVVHIDLIEPKHVEKPLREYKANPADPYMSPLVATGRGSEFLTTRTRRLAIINQVLVPRKIPTINENGSISYKWNEAIVTELSPEAQRLYELTGKLDPFAGVNTELFAEQASEKFRKVADADPDNNNKKQKSKKADLSRKMATTGESVTPPPTLDWADIVEEYQQDNLGTHTTSPRREEPEPTDTDDEGPLMQMEVFHNQLSEIPAEVQAMLQSPFREVRQVAYRLMTTEPNENGQRTVSIFLNVHDSGTVHQYIKHVNADMRKDIGHWEQKDLHHAGVFREIETNRILMERNSTTQAYVQKFPLAQVYIDLPGMEDTARMVSWYDLNFKHTCRVSVINHDSSRNIIPPAEHFYRPDQPLPRESEEGPREYKNRPYWVDLKDTPITSLGRKVLPTDEEISSGVWLNEAKGMLKNDRIIWRYAGTKYEVPEVRITFTDPKWKKQKVYYPEPVHDGREPRWFPLETVVVEKEVRQDNPICRVSQTTTRPPGLYGRSFESALGDLSMNLQGCLEVVTTACAAARGKEGNLRIFSNDDERIHILNNICIAIIEIANSWRLVHCKDKCRQSTWGKNHKCRDCKDPNHWVQCAQCRSDTLDSIYGAHDLMNTTIKRASSDLRVLWQRGFSKDSGETEFDDRKLIKVTHIDRATRMRHEMDQPVQVNPICKMMAQYLNGIVDASGRGSYSRYSFEGERRTLNLPTYGLCLLGFINRSLPTCSDKEKDDQEWSTYLRFMDEKPPHEWDEANRDKVREWAAKAFNPAPLNFVMENFTPPGGTPTIKVPRELFNKLLVDGMIDAQPGGHFTPYVLVQEDITKRKACCYNDGETYVLVFKPSSIEEVNINPRISPGGSWERTRKDGGFAKTLSTVYKALLCIPSSSETLLEWPKTRAWIAKYPERLDARLGDPDGLLEFLGQRGAEFTMAVGEDLLRPFIEHAHVCEREDCTDIQAHLPMMPFGIKELGGKVRVPCITSGFLNAICEPLRRKMFWTIRYDDRTSYRNHDVFEKENLNKVLAQMKEYPITHAGDLTVSTDNFPLWFMEALGLGLRDSGLFSDWELDKFLLCTGPFRMIAPTPTNKLLRKHDMIKDFDYIRDTFSTVYGSSPVELEFQGGKEDVLNLMLRFQSERAFVKETLGCHDCASRHSLCDAHYQEVEVMTPVGETERTKAQKDKILNMLQNKTNDRRADVIRNAQLNRPLCGTCNSTPEEGMFCQECGRGWEVPMSHIPKKERPGVNPNDYTDIYALQQDMRKEHEKKWNKPIYITDLQRAWLKAKLSKTVTQRTRPNVIDETMEKTDSWGEWDKEFGDESLRRMADRVGLVGTCMHCLTSAPNKKIILHTKAHCRLGQAHIRAYLRRTNGLTVVKQLYDEFSAEERRTEFFYKLKTLKRPTQKHCPDPKRAWDYLRYALPLNLTAEYEDQYLTKKGVQMATAVSIGCLYAYNMYADQMARDGWTPDGQGPPTKGWSLLCGDDSLRSGDELFIYIYRSIITSLGGVWSKTKDVMGELQRGVFTELQFENGVLLPIPKVKTLCRPRTRKDKEIAPWRRAIPALNSIFCPDNLAYSLQTEVIGKYPELSDPLLPTQLPKKLGGTGHGRLSGRNQLIWNNIKRIKNPVLANKALAIFRQTFNIKTFSNDQGGKIADEILRLSPPDLVIRNTEAYEGAVHSAVSYRKAHSTLRGLASAALALDFPPEPVTFEKESLFGHTRTTLSIKKEMERKLLDYLYENDLEDLGGQDKKVRGLLPVTPTDDHFFDYTYNALIQSVHLRSLVFGAKLAHD
jgi:hypothetical protein